MYVDKPTKYDTYRLLGALITHNTCHEKQHHANYRHHLKHANNKLAHILYELEAHCGLRIHEEVDAGSRRDELGRNVRLDHT
jgi:hypothetical protein